MLGQITLPDFKRCSLRHMRDVLSGTKGFIHTHAIRKIPVPRYREVTVDTVYEKVKECQNIMSYLPDFNIEKYKPSQVLERTFMF